MDRSHVNYTLYIVLVSVLILNWPASGVYTIMYLTYGVGLIVGYTMAIDPSVNHGEYSRYEMMMLTSMMGPLLFMAIVWQVLLKVPLIGLIAKWIIRE